MANICPVCEKECIEYEYSRGDVHHVNCELCGGKFSITDDAVEHIEALQRGSDIRYKISSFIKQFHLHNKPNLKMYIYEDKSNHAKKPKQIVYGVDEIIQRFPHTINDIFDQILLNLFALDNKPGAIITIKVNSRKEELIPLLFAQDFQAAKYYIEALMDRHYIARGINSTGTEWSIHIKPEGLQRIASIQALDPNLSKDVFVALDFKWKDSYNEAIKPILVELGFNPICMLEHSKSENIDYAINAGIRKSRFIIVDLTHKNRGAYWEAGLGYGMEKVVILCCKKEGKKEPSNLVHFDLNHFNIIFYQNWEELKKELKDRIEGDGRIALE